MTAAHPVLEPSTDIAESVELALRAGLHLEPRCRICRNDVMRDKVNNLLATGSSYAMIVRALADENAKLAGSDRVTIDSVRNHCSRHFPVQNTAKATYREILEQRAKQNGVDFAEGVATAITPIAFLETVMVKSYGHLVDSDTTVDIATGIMAATRLQALLDSRDPAVDLLEIRAKVRLISEAVHSTVPPAMWAEINAKLPGAHKEADWIDEDDGDDDDDEFDPGADDDLMNFAEDDGF